MSLYQRISRPLLAWQYNGQPRSEWPDFVTTYKAHTVLGLAGVSLSNTGVLLVPTPGKSSAAAVNYSDWLVEEDGKVTVVRGDYFARNFEAAED